MVVSAGACATSHDSAMPRRLSSRGIVGVPALALSRASPTKGICSSSVANTTIAEALSCPVLAAWLTRRSAAMGALKEVASFSAISSSAYVSQTPSVQRRNRSPGLMSNDAVLGSRPCS